MKIPATALLPIIAALLLAQGCVTAGVTPLPQTPRTSDLPAVAASFRTRLQHDGHEEIGEWRFWRSAAQVRREDLASRTGEVWQMDGTTLFHTLLFHDDRRGVEYEPADLAMTGEDSSWDKQALIVNPALLARLRLTGSARKGGTPYTDYAGTLEGVRWRVRMRTDLMLPMLIEQRRAGDTLRVELTQALPLAQAPWSPPATEGYGMVDFADLGDHERDPFVLRLQAQTGIGHGHAH